MADMQKSGEAEPRKPVTVLFGTNRQPGRDRRITHTSVEAAFKSSKCAQRPGPDFAWSDDARLRGIFFDASKVQWCDISGCMRLILIVERALRDGLQVWFASPDSLARPNETRFIQFWRAKARPDRVTEIEQNQRRRLQARLFLDRVGFFDALRCEHLPAPAPQRLRVVQDFGSKQEGVPGYGDGSDSGDGSEDREPAGGDEEPAAVRPTFVYELKKSLGPEASPPNIHLATFLKWLPVHTPGSSLTPELRELQKQLTDVLTHRHRGLPNFDAEAFSNVIAYELLENVANHAGEELTHCLLSVWARESGRFTLPDEYLPAEQRFFRDWASANDFPIVEVAIGDSGTGILRSLREAYRQAPTPREAVPDQIVDPSGEERAPTTEESQIFWSLGRWSSKTEQGWKRGTRGLHRVRRLIQSYQGMLTLRCGTALAGWDYGGEENPICAHGLGAIPGTLACVRFSVVAKARRPLSGGARAAADVQFFLCPPLCLRPNGLDDKTLESVRAALAVKQSGRPHCAVAILGQMPTEVAARKTGLEAAMESLRTLPNPGALFLLIFGISPGELRGCIESINARLTLDEEHRWVSGEAGAISNPFCVVDHDLESHWVGVCEWEKPFLQALKETAGGDGVLVDDARTFFDNQAQCDRCLSDLRQHVDFFDSSAGDALRLRLTDHDARQAFVMLLDERLRDEVLYSSTNKGISTHGPYLAPTLKPVNRWVDVPQLVDELCIFQLLPGRVPATDGFAGRQWTRLAEVTDGRTAAKSQDLVKSLQTNLGKPTVIHALAIRFATWWRERIGGDFLMLRTREENSAIAVSFHRLTSLGGQIIELPSLHQLRQTEDVWEIIRDKTVVIFVHCILSGATLRQILNQVIREGGSPAAVACVLDLRSPADGNAKPLLDGGLAVPVISLAAVPEINAEVPDIASLPCIHPDTVAAEGEAAADYPIPWNQLSRYLAETGALHFGHFGLPTNRHFTFFIDPRRLFSSEACVHATSAAITKDYLSFCEAHPDLARSVSEARPLLICSENDLLRKHAERLAEILGFDLKLVRRGQGGVQLQIGREDVSSRMVILLDWSSSSGGRIARTVHSLASLGALAVLAVGWLSRMDPEPEAVLRSWHVLRVTEMIKADLLEAAAEHEQHVPVRIRFLSRAAIPSYSVFDCPICLQRDRIRQEFDRYPSTPPIPSVVEEYVTLSRPHDGARLSNPSFQPLDPFGAAVGPQVTIAMVNIREALVRCITSTSARREVIESLGAAAANPATADGTGIHPEAAAWIVLLATEFKWLKLMPLCLEEARRLLDDLAQAIFDRADVHDAIRRHAIVVLRAADKRVFAQVLPRLIAKVLSNPNLLGQVLYDSFTYIDQTYHRNTFYLEPMLTGLEEAAAVLEQAGARDDTNLRHSLETLNRLSSNARRHLRLCRSSSTPRDGWAILKDKLVEQLRNTHRLYSKMATSWVFGDTEQRQRENNQPVVTEGNWSAIRELWRKVEENITAEIAPLVQQLGRSLLEAPNASQFFGENLRGLLKEFTDPSQSQTLRKLRGLLELFSRNAPLASSPEYEEFKNIREMVNNLLLDPLSGKRQRGARLLRYLNGCPCDLSNTVASFVYDPRWEPAQLDYSPESSTEDFEVFCHEDVVNDFVEQALNNALRIHRRPTMPANPFVYFTLTPLSATHEQSARIRVSIRNSHSDPGYADPNRIGIGGQGLATLQEDIEAFNGCLDRRRITGEDPWTYEITAEFELWEPHPNHK